MVSLFNEYTYGVGHFINDFTESLCFSFLLIYFTSINPLDDKNPRFYLGLIIWSRKIDDGLATLFDKYFSLISNRRFDRKKS